MLGIDESGVASLRRDKHTPRKLNQTEIRKSGVLTEAESPAEPLGRSSAFTVTHFTFFDRILPSDGRTVSSERKLIFFIYLVAIAFCREGVSLSEKAQGAMFIPR